MKTQVIKKDITLDASAEKVWEVLLNDELNRIWYEEFSPGIHAQTDWQVGSKVLFVDTKQSGLIGKVIANKPQEILSVEYQGAVENGTEDYDSEMAQQMKGGREIYQLSGTNGTTHLSIECDMAEEYFESMSVAWDKALQRIKELSEKA